MRTRDVVFQELIRTMALGFIILMFLAVPYRAGFLGLTATYLLAGGLTLACFVAFTLIRLRTGRTLMVQTAAGWAIVAAVTLVLLLVLTSLSVILGNGTDLFPQGIWPVLGGLALIILFTWWGHWRSKRSNKGSEQDS